MNAAERATACYEALWRNVAPDLDASAIAIIAAAIADAEREARAGALEEAEQVCDERVAITIEDMPSMEVCREMESRACTEAIRALQRAAPAERTEAP